MHMSQTAKDSGSPSEYIHGYEMVDSVTELLQSECYTVI